SAMPGCPAFLFFPRFKSYTQVNTMMWDLRGNDAAQDYQRRSPNPRFPMPSPGIPPVRELRRSHDPFPKPFEPLGLPNVPRSAMYSHENLPSLIHEGFPSRARAPPPPIPHATRPPLSPYMPLPPPPHPLMSRPPLPMPIPQSVSKSSHIQPSSRNYHTDARTHTHTRTEDHRHKHHQHSHSTSATPQKTIRHVHFQYSKCTGRKKALCIGINYKGQRRELKGCVNDAHDVKRFLTSNWGYKNGDIVMLVDDTDNPRQMPTRRNILDAMRWLVNDAHPHDALFFHYSGHGGQVPDKDGDEVDGLDEVIYPVDYKKAGMIVDDEMHRIMVKSLPMGCRLTAIFDSCHSGTALDLPFVYHSNGRLKESPVTPQAQAEKATGADVISFAGCRDNQTSADTTQSGMAVGAMSYAFVASLTRKPVQSYQELLKSVRDILRQHYRQKPQLSSSHPIVSACSL
ncbi:caspase domain-containing protein, partial [Suillus bovinus]|uniref:caspase domain-containing protein n=1 Tax=Suillus bovinus TaxID=48563 RepID=UPI001B8664CF